MKNSEARGKTPWSVRSPMLGVHNEVAVATLNRKVYAIGGSNPTNYQLNSVEEYDPTNDEWRECAPAPRGFNHGSATVLNNKIYVVGGFTQRQHGGATRIFLEYDPLRNSWLSPTQLNTALGSVSAVALGQKIHVIGGRGLDNVSVANHDVYDPANGTWTKAAPLSRARDHIVAIVVDGKIHAIGGRFSGVDDFTDLHDIYDPRTNSWSSGPPLPTPRSNGAGALYKGMLFVVGGEGGPKSVFDETEAFDLATGRWLKLAPLSAGTHGFGAAVVDDEMYFVGGSFGSGTAAATNQLLTFSLT